ncbi:methyl-accepting chemotaxis protein [Haloferax namakaokahaiae]|uniref:Methyl-accepting chemotaxis protein n=1 Tax=Haloferax namakaokahaiae TaxID=1748331 RepID=A0ABD5ZDT4_9EURY
MAQGQNETVATNMLTDAGDSAVEIGDWAREHQSSAQMLSSLDAVTSGEPAAVERAFDAQRPLLPAEVEAIQYVDRTTGEVIAANGTGGVTETAPWAGSLTFSERSEVALTDIYSRDGNHYLAFVSPTTADDTHAVSVVVNLAKGFEFETAVEGAQTHLVTGDGTVVLSKDSARIQTAYTGPSAAVERSIAGEQGLIVENGTATAYVPFDGTYGLVVQAPTSVFGVDTQTLTYEVVVFVMIAAGLAVVGVTFVRNTSRSINKLSSQAKRLEDGDFEVGLETGRKDEVGELYHRFGRMRDALEETVEGLRTSADSYSKTMEQCAAGDLTRRLDEDVESEEMADVATSFNSMMDDIESTVQDVNQFAVDVELLSEQVNTGATEMNDASEEVATSVSQISDGAREQTRQLSSVAMEMDELSTTVEEIASSAEGLAENATEAATVGADGRIAAEDALSGMNAIRKETQTTAADVRAFEALTAEIGDIVAVIQDIAEQTNLLALNANIEAARAGEAGSGFAVVANEVKQLAEETSNSAEDVSELIEDVQAQRKTIVESVTQMNDRVEDGTESVEEAIDSLERMGTRIEETESSVYEVTQATKKQAESTEEVSSMVTEVSGVSEETSAQAETVSVATEQQVASASEVRTSADTLTERAGKLRTLLAAFDTRGSTVADGTDRLGHTEPVNEESGKPVTSLSADGGVNEK